MPDTYKKNPIYRTIELFCAIRGKSIGAMCKRAGVSPGLVTDLKMGRKQTIQVETAAKLAEALRTDVDTLMNNRYEKALSWDVDTCLKWYDADSIDDQQHILENYGVDVQFFLSSENKEWKAVLEEIVFHQKPEQKERPNLGEEVGPKKAELLAALADMTEAEQALLLEHIQKIKSLRGVV